MEPLTAIGTVASVVQLAGAALQLSKTLYTLGSAVGSANDDLHDLADDLKIFSQSLTLLSRLLEDSKAWYSDDIYLLTAKIIKDCAELYAKIDVVLAKLGGNGKSTWITRVKFVYKEGQIRKLLKRLRDMKGTLATILMSLQVDLQLSLLNISSSSKIQRMPERPLQPETVEMLKDAQKAVDTNEAVSRYTFRSDELEQSCRKVSELPATYREQESHLSEFSEFLMLPIPAANSRAYGSNGTASLALMPEKLYPVFQRRKVIHSSVDQNTQSNIECSPDASLRRSISMDSFKSAVSFQGVQTDLINRVNAVQEVLHAFRTALETLQNLVQRRGLKRNEELYSASEDLKASLEKGEMEIGMVYESRYETVGSVYCTLFAEQYKTELHGIGSDLLKEIVLVLHLQSADHVLICRSEFDTLYRHSESYRQRAIVVLHGVGAVESTSAVEMASQKHNIWWSSFRKAAPKKLDVPLSEDLIDLDIADPETIMNLKAEDRVVPKIPDSSPPGSPQIEASMHSGQHSQYPISPSKNFGSIPDNDNRAPTQEMSLPFIGYTFRRFEQNLQALAPSAGNPSPTTEDPSSTRNFSMTVHDQTSTTKDDSDKPRPKQDSHSPKAIEQRRAEILAKNAKLQELRRARAMRDFKGEIVVPLAPLCSIPEQMSTSNEERKPNPIGTEFRPSPFTDLKRNKDTNKDVLAVVSELSKGEYGQIVIDSDLLQDVNPKQVHRILMRRQLRERFEKDLQENTKGCDENGDGDNSLVRPPDNMEPSFSSSALPRISSSNSSYSHICQEGSPLNSKAPEDTFTKASSITTPETTMTPKTHSKDATAHASTVAPHSDIIPDRHPRRAVALSDALPSDNSSRLGLRKGQIILIDPTIPSRNGWLFAVDGVKRQVGWVHANLIRYLEPLTANAVNSAPSEDPAELSGRDIKPSYALKAMRKGIWWQAYLALLTDDQSKESIILRNTLSHEFASLTSSHISDESICGRISDLLSRSESASFHFSPVFMAMKNLREHRASIIKIAMTFEKSEIGFDIAVLGWACVAVSLALYDPLFTNTSAPITNLTANETKNLTKTFQQLEKITSIIARYAVKENIFSRHESMSLTAEYEQALTDLAITIFRWFAHAFTFCSVFCPADGGDSSLGMESNGSLSELISKALMEKIWAQEQACGRFRIVFGVEEDDRPEARESSDSEGESDSDWEKVDYEPHEEGEILDLQSLNLASNF